MPRSLQARASARTPVLESSALSVVECFRPDRGPQEPACHYIEAACHSTKPASRFPQASACHATGPTAALGKGRLQAGIHLIGPSAAFGMAPAALA